MDFGLYIWLNIYYPYGQFGSRRKDQRNLIRPDCGLCDVREPELFPGLKQQGPVKETQMFNT